MCKELLGVVAVTLLCGSGQALPSFPRQVVYRGGVLSPIDAVPELKSARLEFMAELDGAVSQVVSEITGQYLEDTPEVKEVKAEFMKVFNNALSGFINTAYLDDTAEVAAAKKEFLAVFDAATNGLLTTIENFYLEDTAEVKDAKELFNRAFEDAKAGRVGAQYIAYTPEVQKARDEFLRFFDLVVNGMLYKLAPQPIPNFYIADTPAVNSAKTQFLQLYKSALTGDIKAALTVVALEEAISNNANNPALAAQEFVQTATELQDMIRILEGGNSLNIVKNEIPASIPYVEEAPKEAVEEAEKAEETDAEVIEGLIETIAGELVEELISTE